MNKEKIVNVEALKEYNIYAGLGGGFGGLKYQFTTICESEEEASEIAYAVALNDYEEYEGNHGLLSFDEVAEDNDLDPELDYDAVYELYMQEVESWICYNAILTSEDTSIPEDHLVRDYVIEECEE